MSQSKFGIVVLILIILSTGYLLGVFFQHDLILVDNRVDVLSALSILSSLFVVIYLSILFEKAREGDRIKKEIVLRKCGKLEASIDNLYELIDRDNINVTELTSLLKSLSVTFYSVVGFIKTAKYSLGSFESEFLRQLHDLRKRSSSYSSGSNAKSGMCISNNEVTYDISRKTGIRTTILELESIAIRLEFDIAVQ